jgi:hypothetical protein
VRNQKILKTVVIILNLFLLFTVSVFSQAKSYAGKTFVNDKLDQIDFVNDTVLSASFRAFPEKYSFRNDSLVFTLSHHHSDMEFEHSYKLLKHSSDTLAFVYTSLYSKPDTIQFVNVQNRIVPITDFDSIRVDSYGWAGFGRIIIRSDKMVFAEGDFILPNEQPRNYKQFKLTNEQYQKLIDTLSKSLIFMLPEYRGDTDLDTTDTDFYIHSNSVSIISKGSVLSRIHYKLVKYLFDYIGRGN